jgi:hypothetical protein
MGQEETDESDRCAGPQRVPSEEGRLPSRLHHHAEEAELCAPEGGSRSTYQRDGDHHLHPRYRPQSPGALGRSREGRAGERPSRRSLPYRSRRAGYVGCPGPETGSIQVRHQEAEIAISGACVARRGPGRLSIAGVRCYAKEEEGNRQT